MTSVDLPHLSAAMKLIKMTHEIGRIVEISKTTIAVSGLEHISSLGDLVEVETDEGERRGEILQLTEHQAIILVDGGVDGLSIGDSVIHIGANTIAPDNSWVGRIIDPFGKSLNGKPVISGLQQKPLRAKSPNPTARKPWGERLETGMKVFNTMLPIVRGQRIGLFAGSGVGKTSLLAKLAQGLEADVVVIAMIGERGREVREFAENVLGPEGMKRSVIVAATSDQSAMIRRRCAWSAMCVAEYFRDQGKQVLFLADSITRFAEAHREVALATGEESSLRGFPPSTVSMITGLCERAGPGEENAGDITAVLSVLVSGSDMDEPVADILRGVLDGHIVLDRKIAERGRFPAIDLLRSVSRSLPKAASFSENELINAARKYLGAYDRSEMMIQAGLYSNGTDPILDKAIQFWAGLDEFLSQNETQDSQKSFQDLAHVMGMKFVKGR